MSRINGQIWIDKKVPNRAKYFVNGEEYTILVSDTYVSSGNFPAGTVVSLTREGKQELVASSFPDDLDRVLGVLLNDVRTGEKGSIIQAGKVIINVEDVNNSSLISEDIEKLNSWTDKTKILGTPVYWSTGYIDSKKSYHNSIDGKLTIKNPAGHCWFLEKLENFPDLSSDRNIGYDNLPQTGVIAGYTMRESKLSELTIYFNFSKFDSSIEWTWPYVHITNNCGVVPANANLDLYVGLNKSTTLSHPVNFIDIEACEANTSFENIYHIETFVETNGNKMTVHLNSPELLKYRISGRVSYKFDIQHEKGV